MLRFKTFALAVVLSIVFGSSNYRALADSTTTSGARVIENPTQDGNLVMRINDGGVKTDAITVTGSSSAVSLGPTTGVSSNHTLYGRGSVSASSLNAIGSVFSFGADNTGAVSRTNNTIKEFRLVEPPYANANPDFLVLRAKADTANNSIIIGGSSSSFTSATDISFMTNSAGVADLSGGATVGSINSAGAWTVGPSAFTGVHTTNGNTVQVGSNANGSPSFVRKIYAGQGTSTSAVTYCTISTSLTQTTGYIKITFGGNQGNIGTYSGYKSWFWSNTGGTMTIVADLNVANTAAAANRNAQFTATTSTNTILLQSATDNVSNNMNSNIIVEVWTDGRGANPTLSP